MLATQEESGKAVGTKPHLSPALASGIRVTKDDIRLKAKAVIQSLLPGMWKVSRSRKRLRGVSLSELPWRSEVNLLMGASLLEVLVAKLPKSVANNNLPAIDVERLRFDNSMVIITGVVPVHVESIPGHKEAIAGHHHTTPHHQVTEGDSGLPDRPKESGLVQELRQMLLSFQRSLVSTVFLQGCTFERSLCPSPFQPCIHVHVGVGPSWTSLDTASEHSQGPVECNNLSDQGTRP